MKINKRRLLKNFTLIIFLFLIIIFTKNIIKRNLNVRLVNRQIVDFEYYDRKLTIKDFEQFDYDTTFEDMVEQIGEPNGMWGSGVAYPYYELSDGKFVFCNFWLYKKFIWIKMGTKNEINYVLLPAELPPKSDEERGIEVKNAKKSEFNAILSLLEIREWKGRYYSSIEWDEPLGSYSKEKLNKYTNKNLKIDISYYYGEYINEPFQPLFQIFEIYNDDKQIYFGFKLWEEEWILAEGGYTLNDQEEIIIEDEDLSEIKLDPKYFVNSIIEFMSNKRKIKRGRDAWVELWGRDENGKYMCVYITSPIKREEGIDADSKVVSYYYVTIDTVDNKAEEIHVKKLKK